MVMSPFIVLKVPVDANDQVIRQAYLNAIKQAPPDTHPGQFQAVNQAYEKIKDETSRNKYRLFNTDCTGDSPLDAFVQYARFTRPACPLPWEEMKKFLVQCAQQ